MIEDTPLHAGAYRRKQIVALLKKHPDGLTRREIEIALNITDCSSIQRMLKPLIDARLIHVGAWRTQSAGVPCPTCKVFFYGPGVSVPRPTNNRRNQMAAAKRRFLDSFGRELYHRVDKARRNGASRLVIDGVVVWQRGIGVFKSAAQKLRGAD